MMRHGLPIDVAAGDDCYRIILQGFGGKTPWTSLVADDVPFSELESQLRDVCGRNRPVERVGYVSRAQESLNGRHPIIEKIVGEYA